MEPKIEEVASRIRSLREDLDISMQEMAQATGRSLSEYAAQESGVQDLSFTFLSKCANRFGVDVVERWHDVWKEYEGEGLLSIEPDRVILTRDGLLCVDGLLPAFFEPEMQGVRYT